MFTNLLKAGGPFQNIDLRVVNRTGAGLTVGEVVQLMLNLDVDGGTTAEAKGGGPGQVTGTGTGIATGAVDMFPYDQEDGVFCNIDDVAAVSENVMRIFAVVTDLLDGGGADDSECVVRLQGLVTVNATSANYDIGDSLQVTSAANTVSASVAATGQRPVGISLTEADSQTSIRAMFWGWFGLMSQHE